MGLAFFHQEIGRNLEDDVGNEEDGEGDVGLVAFEVQVLG